MKRTKRIDLDAMRKAPRLYPSALALSVSMALVGCGSDTGKIYKTVSECAADNPGNTSLCETAYQNSLNEAERSGPKYKTKSDCSSDFDRSQCVSHSNGSWFAPMMAGFMIGNLLDQRRGYAYQPIYTSYRYGSPLYGTWHSTDGMSYGSTSYRTVSTNSNTFKSKPAVSRTISRGGFGSVAKAKASWSSARSSSGGFKGGWGG